MTLMETGQEVPDFLQQYKPEGKDASNLKFEYDTDEEEADEGGDAWGTNAANTEGDGGDGWGAGGDPAVPEGNNGGGNTDGWGASTNGNEGGAGWGANGTSDW